MVNNYIPKNKRNDLRDNPQEIIRLYKDKLMNTYEIGKKYNCGDKLISNILKENNALMNLSERRKLLFKNGKLKSWSKGLTKETDERIKLCKKQKSNLWGKQDEIIKMYEENLLSPERIAKLYNCSGSLIDHILKQNNVMRNNSERRKLLSKEGKLKIWSKGLTKETDERVKKFADNLLGRKIDWGNKISETQKRRYKEGKLKSWNKRTDLINNPQDIIRLYLQNDKNIKQIGGVYNCSVNTIYRILKKNNIKMKNKKSKETRERLSKSRIEKGVAKLEKNPAWFGGKSFEPYTPEFNRLFKLAIKQRDNHSCLKCGLFEEDCKRLYGHPLGVHHIDYIKENTFKENCCCLCVRCNAEVNFNRPHWTKFFQSLLAERYGYKYDENQNIIINLNNQLNLEDIQNGLANKISS